MILLKNKDKKANIKIGNNIEIKDGNDFPFDLTLYGKSTQATRSGKNLFTKQGNATPKTDTTFWGDITNTTPESDGWCKVSVDNTNGTELAFANQMTKRNTIDKLEVNTMYSILIEVRNLIVSGSGNISPILQLCETTKNSVWQSRQEYDLTVLPKTSKMVFQILTKTNFDSSIYDFRNYVSIPKGYKVEFEYRLMVVKGSYTLDTIGEYEQYGVSPSPDYPSPIESIEEINIEVNNSNFINANNIKNSNIIISNDGAKITMPLITNGNGYTSTGSTLIQLCPNLKVGDVVYLNAETTSGFNKFAYLEKANKSWNFGASMTLTKDMLDSVFVLYGNRFSSGETEQVDITNLRITKNINDSWEKYQSNITNINLQGNELCSIGDVKDELIIDNGKAKIIKKVGEIVYDGSGDEIWSYGESGIEGIKAISITLDDMLSGNYLDGLSNYFHNDKSGKAKNSIRFGANSNLMFIYVDETEFASLTDFKTWLSTHNTTLYYELATPTEIDLGTTEMPYTYNGVSNITNSADTEMVVKYYKKFEFDKILRSGYNIDEQEHEIAKKQMANGKRKKILSSYVDCIIKINLGLLDNKTYQEYKEQLEDGEYEYFSYRYNQYKKANFILTKPSINTEYAYDDDIGIDDMEITLEKSSDVS